MDPDSLVIALTKETRGWKKSKVVDVLRRCRRKEKYPWLWMNDVCGYRRGFFVD